MSDVPNEPDFEDPLPAADAEGKPPVGDAPSEAPILSAKDLETIKADARKKVQKDIRAAAMKKAMAEFEEEARIEAGLVPEEGPIPTTERVSVRIDVPRYVPWVLLDKRRYYHGYSYDVTPAVAATLIDQMQHTWRQERQTKGDWFGPGHQQQNVVIGKAGDVVNTARSLRR